jgi:hypothetical protein
MANFEDLENLKKLVDVDMVNRPPHYNREGGMESIDEMVLVFGKEAVKNFCLCNVWKYRYRAADKNGQEDLKKSDWYLRKYKELCKEDKEPNPYTIINTLPPIPNYPMNVLPTTTPYYYDSIKVTCGQN